MFKVYATLDQRTAPGEVAERARRAEALGYDGLNVPEAVHDGLVGAALALSATKRLRVATSVLVAFPRSPMSVALAAWDLQALSAGRFELGLGPQVRGNVVKRYGTPWTAPAPRMRDYVGALRAIFACWQDGAELRFESEHYEITRMQPFFDPGPVAGGAPPIFLGAIGPAMTAVAGEVADGMVTHPTNTVPRYIREVIHPRLERGAKRAGRSGSDVALMLGPLVATGIDSGAVALEREKQRELLTFLYSTPAYWPSLELFGWRERGERLHALTREGKWDEMRGVIDDEMLDLMVPSGTYDEIAAVLCETYGELTERLTFPVPEDPAHDDAAAKAIAALRSGEAGS